MLYNFQDNPFPDYHKEQGYGFLKTIPKDMNPYPELYGNFIIEPGSQMPFIFMADVKPGTYNITVVLRGKGYLFSQQRRLSAVCNTTTQTSFHFSVVTGDFIAGYDKKRHAHNKIVLFLCGELEVLSIDITPKSMPVVWLAGDSTVTDQKTFYPYNPGLTFCGWGQILSYFLSPNYALYNLAQSGLTTDMFRNEGYYSILYEHLKEGDYVLIQFGHNDQKRESLKANERYYDNLVQFVEEIKSKHAIPVLITPLARNTWNGKTKEYNDLLKDYANATRKAAHETNTYCIDLHRISLNHIKNMGLEKAKPFFHFGDHTHTNDYGAFFFAGIIWKEIMNQEELSDLKCLFTNETISSPFTLPESKGWLSPPQANCIHHTDSGIMTVLDALDYVKKSYNYFCVNPLGDELEAVNVAKQNGYYLDTFETIKRPILWKEWEELLFLACSGRYETVMTPEVTFPANTIPTWNDATKYAQAMEQMTTGCITKDNSPTIVVEGS